MTSQRKEAKNQTEQYSPRSFETGVISSIVTPAEFSGAATLFSCSLELFFSSKAFKYPLFWVKLGGIPALPEKEHHKIKLWRLEIA